MSEMQTLADRHTSSAEVGTRSPRGRTGWSLSDMATNLFSLILTLRRSSNYGEESELRRQITKYLEKLEQDGINAGLSRQDLEEVKFPLVIFIDETILSSEWPHRISWRDHPLQLDLYGSRTGGEAFFSRIDEIRRRGRDQHHLLEIYYLCLALGFEGKYGITGDRQGLNALTDGVRRELGYGEGKPNPCLSPHGEPPDRASRKRARKPVPSRLVPVVSVLALLVIWGACWLFLELRTNGAIATMESLVH